MKQQCQLKKKNVAKGHFCFFFLKFNDHWRRWVVRKGGDGQIQYKMGRRGINREKTEVGYYCSVSYLVHFMWCMIPEEICSFRC